MKALKQAVREQKWTLVSQLIAKWIAEDTSSRHSMQSFSGTLPLPPTQKGQQMASIGEVLYRKHRYADAIICLEYALTLQPKSLQQAHIHGWLAELYSLTTPHQNFEKAQFHSQQAFAWRDHIATDHLASRKVLAYSLYGGLPLYCETMIINAQLRAQIYPDWEMMLYHDDSVPQHVLQRLSQLGVQLCNADEHHATHMPGTFWRFLALEHSEYDVVVMRDADSLLTWREKTLVDDWLASGKPFHVIHDWYSHTDLILAGLWGARYGLLQPIRQWIEQYLEQTPHLHRTHADQNFLATFIWHRIKDACVNHSSVFNVPNSTWLPELPAIHIDPRTNKRQQLGSWQSKTYTFPLSPNQRVATIRNERSELVCEYPIPHDGKWEIPTLYYQLIEDKIWTVHAEFIDS